MWPGNVLAARDAAPQQGPLAAISPSTDPAWLQRIVMEPEFAAKLAAKPLGWPQPGVLRRAPYIQLGSLRTAANLAVIGTIEAAMATRVIAAETVSIDDWPKEENGSGKGLAESVEPDGQTYRVVFWNLQGQHDLNVQPYPDRSLAVPRTGSIRQPVTLMLWTNEPIASPG
jgi:hypothetical protein